MGIETSYFLRCDHKNDDESYCDNEFGSDLYAYESIGELKSEAKSDGWVEVRGWWFCPKHAQVEVIE